MGNNLPLFAAFVVGAMVGIGATAFYLWHYFSRDIALREDRHRKISEVETNEIFSNIKEANGLSQKIESLTHRKDRSDEILSELHNIKQLLKTFKKPEQIRKGVSQPMSEPKILPEITLAQKMCRQYKECVQTGDLSHFTQQYSGSEYITVPNALDRLRDLDAPAEYRSAQNGSLVALRSDTSNDYYVFPKPGIIITELEWMQGALSEVFEYSDFTPGNSCLVDRPAIFRKTTSNGWELVKKGALRPFGLG